MSIASVALNLEIQGDKEGGGPNRNEFKTVTIISEIGSVNVNLSCNSSDVLTIFNSPAATKEWLSTTNLIPIADEGDYSTVEETNEYINNNYTNTNTLETNYINDNTLTTNFYTSNAINIALDSYTTTTDLETNYIQNSTLDNYYTKTEMNSTFQPIGNYLSGVTFTSTKISIDVPTMGHNGSQIIQNVTIPNFIGSNTTAYIAKGEDSYLTIICSFQAVSGLNTLVTLTFRNNSTLSTPSPYQTIPISIFAMN